jgi:hypothetical protein
LRLFRFAVHSTTVTPPSSSFRRVPPLQSSFVRRASPAPFRTELDLPRFPSLFATSPARVYLCEASQLLARFVLGFLNPSTVFSAFGLAGLFHPAATSRASCSGCSSPAQPPSLVGRSVPPCRFSVLRSPTEIGCRKRPLRLRGFDPHAVALQWFGYSPRPCPLPSSGSSPPGAPFSRGAPVLLGALHSCRYRRQPSLSRSPPAADFSVYSTRDPDCLSPDLRPARGFEPSIRNPKTSDDEAPCAI